MLPAQDAKMQHENRPGEWPFPVLLPRPQVLHLYAVYPNFCRLSIGRIGDRARILILCQEECKNVYPLQERFAPTSTFSFLTNRLPV